jgi:excisionase family DNA binding protein
METDERPVENEKLWMRVPEAATYFQVPRSRMYDLIQSGQLPAVRIGERSIRVCWSPALTRKSLRGIQGT